MRVALALIFLLCAGAAQADDWRAYHHGIGFVPDGAGRYWVFYSAVDDPKREVGDEEEWTHNIYVANWGPKDSGALAPHLFIHRPGAQEPVSVAAMTNGHILVTAEDGGDTENDVDQRYGVYKNDLQPVRRYGYLVREGGHSGHTAAVGDLFVVFYSHEWVEGGGVDDLGSGDGVYAKIYDSDGGLLRAVPVAARKREWWPVIAGAPQRALLVWQKFMRGFSYAALKFTMLDPATGQLSPVQMPREDLQYYTYNAAYMPRIDRFIILGTNKNGRGFGYLVDRLGRITATLLCMPATVREAGIAIDGDDAYTPGAEDRMLQLHATPTSLTLTGVASSPFTWAEEGSIGLPKGKGLMHWVSLDRDGLQEADFAAVDFAAPGPSDLCRVP